jgi:hypothetical protein
MCIGVRQLVRVLSIHPVALPYDGGAALPIHYNLIHRCGASPNRQLTFGSKARLEVGENQTAYTSKRRAP